jgi:hypothetical protein
VPCREGHEPHSRLYCNFDSLERLEWVDSWESRNITPGWRQACLYSLRPVCVNKTLTLAPCREGHEPHSRLYCIDSLERLEWVDSCGVPVDFAIDTMLEHNPKVAPAELDYQVRFCSSSIHLSVPISSPSARVLAHLGPCEQDRRALVAIDSVFLPASLSLDCVYPDSQQLRALHPPSAYPLSLFNTFQGQHEKPELCPLSRKSPCIMASWNDIVIILITHSNIIYQPCPRLRECVCRKGQIGLVKSAQVILNAKFVTLV